MEDYIKKIIDIIKENFPNGVRGDFIDIRKIWRIYPAKYSDEKISQNFIFGVIHSQGIKIGERFYFISDDEIKKTLVFCSKIFEKNLIVFYSEVFEKHSYFFSSLDIFSPEILKKILRENDKENFYFDEFCSPDRMTRLKYEISKIFMTEEKSLSLEDLQEIFPYVPAEKILSELNTKKYLPTLSGKYFPVSKIKFDREEIFMADKKISAVIEEKNSASFDDYDLSSNFFLNPEISENVLLNLIHKKFFADKFTMRGKNFFKKGRKSSNFVKNIFENFLVNRDEVTFSELLNCARQSGNDSRQISSMTLNYALKNMIRADENFFVKDELINFDVAEIDEALTPFVQGKIISLRAVTSFTGFPPVVGYSWNLFLLESFLRKYSEKFSHSAPNANSANIGAIFPKSMTFENYFDVQIAVLLQENIPLEKSAVENFLVEQGFRATRNKKITLQLLEKAQEISNL